MNKKYILLSGMLLLVGAGYYFINNQHLTLYTIFRLSRAIAREGYNWWIRPEATCFNKMPYLIRGELVTLRKLECQDFDFYYPIIGNPYCADNFFINNTINMVPEVNPTFYLYLQKIGQFFGSRVIYSVIDNKTDKIGGMIELFYAQNKTVAKKPYYEICGLARPKEWGNGKALQATGLAINAFFSSSKETELMAHVAPYNLRCQTFLIKCGFEFCTISEDEDSQNELLFKIYRDKGLTITQAVRELLRHQQVKMHYS